uniref:Uncharacterized protein n=1 Tax=Romanomermis culicivorax TaxID=13658 RepID=A0A915JH17_ROMCU
MKKYKETTIFKLEFKISVTSYDKFNGKQDRKLLKTVKMALQYKANDLDCIRDNGGSIDADFSASSPHFKISESKVFRHRAGYMDNGRNKNRREEKSLKILDKQKMQAYLSVDELIESSIDFLIKLTKTGAIGYLISQPIRLNDNPKCIN